MRGFSHVDTWVFDLDNTLYPASCRLFDQIDVRMGEFVSRLLGTSYEDAKKYQKTLFHKYGTTLRGLMVDHGVNPDGFLDYVHDIDHTPVPANTRMDAALHALPGRKLIFTNGTVAHAEKVLARLGITHHFGDIFDIVHSDFIPKPERPPYAKFIAQTGITPQNSAMFEDIARNLEAPHALGMTTVLVTSPENHDAQIVNSTSGGIAQPHIHHVTDDLTGFLENIVKSRSGS
ncbi:pyrimidine 5'-nucleotidase [Aestuariivirga sp.]|uniref:pyrimidine 5'-nucleotidase n=1 Tax=Aestuariivirga sp. TaxID=2650926 RepID=UPI0039E26A2A